MSLRSGDMKVRAMVGVLVFVSIIWATIPTWGMSVNSMRAKGRIISRGTSKGQVIKWAGKPDYVEVISEGVWLIIQKRKYGIMGRDQEPI